MSLPSDGWKNKKGTADRTCACGSWKQHWINFSGKEWPSKCSVQGCNNSATLGGHIFNSDSSLEEYIVPMCDSCNKRTEEFSLKSVTCVSANQSKTCGKK